VAQSRQAGYPFRDPRPEALARGRRCGKIEVYGDIEVVATIGLVADEDSLMDGRLGFWQKGDDLGVDTPRPRVCLPAQLQEPSDGLPARKAQRFSIYHQSQPPATQLVALDQQHTTPPALAVKSGKELVVARVIGCAVVRLLDQQAAVVLRMDLHRSASAIKSNAPARE
jgi:hypothetical protein